MTPDRNAADADLDHAPVIEWGEALPDAQGTAARPLSYRAPRLAPRVFVLLSTYNGAAYLDAQLDSLLTQTHLNWTLFWRDDGSDDRTVAVLQQFAIKVGKDRCVRFAGEAGRLWPAASYMTLLRAVVPLLRQNDLIAFADQDDVWLPDKLARGVMALTTTDTSVGTLYCARLRVVDAELRQLRETNIHLDNYCFPASLTQNIATGCTVMLNRSAARLVAGSTFPSGTLHDWWCYLLITAAGGRVLADNEVVALYRQHDHNFVGMQATQARRAFAALRRGPAPFMATLRHHLAALVQNSSLLSVSARPVAVQLHSALQGGIRQRLRVLRLPALRRQGRLETLLFRLWFLIG